MSSQLVIINRKPEKQHSLTINFNLNLGALWKTCLRNMFITDMNALPSLQLAADDEVYTEENAYAYLISVLCGLESPVFGETEVFGQFKNFIETEQKNYPHLFSQSNKGLKFIIEQVKTIRSEFIQGLGSNSYGSTLRKLTKEDDHISMIGAGHLATELIPWIAKNKSLHIYVRDQSALTKKYSHLESLYPGIKIFSLKNGLQKESCLVIAAPMNHHELINFVNAAEKKPLFIYDLRHEGFDALKNELKNQTKLLSLSDFFEIFNRDKIKFDAVKKEINSYIKSKCHEFYMRSDIRPMGWDDLCL